MCVFSNFLNFFSHISDVLVWFYKMVNVVNVDVDLRTINIHYSIEAQRMKKLLCHKQLDNSDLTYLLGIELSDLCSFSFFIVKNVLYPNMKYLFV